MLPNLKKSELIAGSYSEPMVDVSSLTDTVSKELQAWSKMETLKTEIRVPSVQYMLSSVAFSSLTRITVRFPRTDTNCVIAKAA